LSRRGSTKDNSYFHGSRRLGTQRIAHRRDRVHDGWLPDRARQQLRWIIKRIQVQIHQSREYSYVHEGS